jgi:hypothetical protein
MRLMLLLVVLSGACDEGDATLPMPDAARAQLDAHVDYPDDGFGNACTQVYNPYQLYTDCESLEGLPGCCTTSGCRRWCGEQDECPPNQEPVYTVENKCYCEPVP